jgi:Galactose oxidase, central domain
MKLHHFILLLAASLFSTACGGGGTSKTTPPATMYTIGGTVSGLAGTGLVLQNNGGSNLPLSANTTKFAFPTAVPSGTSYKIAVMTQPSNPTQSCIVTGGSGTVNGNVTNASVACATTTYTVGGSITGLVGTGLVLQDNSSDNLPVSANATAFTFGSAVASTGGFKVSVMTQPSNPTQNCVVSGGSGTVNGDVTSVSIACTTTKYTVGGTISGLAGTGLVLQDNSGDNLTVTQGATGFTFATAVDGGAGYKVTVLTQPTNPTQTCAPTGASGTSNVDVTTVLVTCSNISQWTWVNGPIADDQSGVYGVLGTADSTNIPGARYWGSSWTDASGKFWLFGGYGYDSIGTVADVNDLWQGSYDSTGTWNWTWMGGSNLSGAAGTYGTLGVADAANMPGARDSASTWTDSSGNVYLFGGHGYDSTRTADNLNDLWKYSAGQWTWVSGANVVNQQGTYGTQGTADPSNTPGARYSATSWMDKQGNFWLFGGMGYDSTGTVGYLNDLWKGSYNSSAQWIWTWVAGSSVANTKGSYGTKGVASASNAPGARYLSSNWMDKQGNLWLFGGYGTDSVGDTATLSDLWKFSVSTGEWTSMGGLQTAGATGVYGTLGVPDPANIPGSRKGAVTWADSNGNSWLFGGIGFDSTGNAGELNDLWEYNPTTGYWTWQSGSNLVGSAGDHGTLGVGGSTTVPGARGGAPNWIDAAGNLWMFGGNGPISGVNGSFSDLWKYVP